MRTIRIVTPTAAQGKQVMTAHGTKVYADDGTEITGVLRISISPLDVSSIVTAEIELCISKLDVTAHPLLDLKSLREAAEIHGYRLVPKG